MNLNHQPSPFRIWNLRRNPFGELTPEERSELAVVERLESWLAELEHSRTALQFVGACGRGKTTHLLALKRSLAKAAYVYFPESGKRPALPTTRPLLVDEAQRMGRWNTWRLLRGPGPIAISTHVDLSLQLQAAGFKTISVNMNDPLGIETLTRILNGRIAASCVGNSQPLINVSPSVAAALIRKYGSDVREMEAFLYESLQSTLLGRTAWPPAI